MAKLQWRKAKKFKSGYLNLRDENERKDMADKWLDLREAEKKLGKGAATFTGLRQ